MESNKQLHRLMRINQKCYFTKPMFVIIRLVDTNFIAFIALYLYYVEESNYFLVRSPILFVYFSFMFNMRN